MDISQLISYYKDCYQTDTRTLSLTNFFSSKGENELDWGKYLTEHYENQGFIARLPRRYIQWRNSLEQPHWELTKELLDGLDKRVKLIKTHVKLDYDQQVETALVFERKVLKTFPLPFTYWKFDRPKCMKELILFSEI